MTKAWEFSGTLFDTICERIADGESLRTICSGETMPSKGLVLKWLANDATGALRDQYARAREMQADTIADETFDIADDASNDWMQRNGKDDEPGWALNGEHVQRSRLRIDQRKWYLSKVAPKKYGDKLAVGGDPDAPPIRVEARVIDVSGLDMGELEALESALTKMVGGGK